MKDYILLVLLCLLLYLPGISTLPIVDRDSPHFAQATRQMLETGDWWQIQFVDKPRHAKPPGIYWLQAASVKLFSQAESSAVWPYRIPSVLGGILAVLLTYAFATRLYDKQVARVSAAILAPCLLLVMETHLVTTDAFLCATVVLMQGALALIYQRVAANIEVGWRLPILFWLGMGLGILIKGITPIIAVITLLSLCCADRSWAWLKQLKWSLCILMLVATLAWLIPLSLAGHSYFFWDMVSQDLLPKLAKGQESHGMPPGYYVLIFNLVFWPTAVFIFHAYGWGWLNRHNPVERFLLLWIIPVWLFFELVPTKLPHYELPIFPAVAILMAKAILMVQAEGIAILPRAFQILARIQYVLWTIVSLAFAIGISVIAYLLQGHVVLSALVVSILIIATTMAMLWYIAKRQLIRAVVISLAGSILIFATLLQWTLPNLTNLWLSDKVVSQLPKASYPVTAAHPLITAGYEEPSLIFLLGTHQVEIFGRGGASMKDVLDDPQQLVLIIDEYLPGFLQATKQANRNIRIVSEIKGYSLGNGRWFTLYLLETQKNANNLSVQRK